MPPRRKKKRDPLAAVAACELSRLARGDAAGEDVVADLLGYLVLLRVRERRAVASECGVPP